MPPGRYEEVMRRDFHRCQFSARGWPTDVRCSGELVVHHILPRGMGGSSDPAIHDLDNLVVLCGGVTGRDGHHGLVEDERGLAYEFGLLRRRERRPLGRS